ncbi:uncharacterized protein BDR25DRAFT_294415 [Lindgomyces ingoldianus]|uniref:Uncharacterized protein n=1 Tax=Lindgomyces ingoldianus TaxID=673940 RepID=A0ACB6QFR4_9PLEO|nr:uncharacterized protein BDR25DRAFT_294415 [Lindgomyces ingoldianus]KAF2465869.1 hypothetical protein BDR25DRAFT_294415 [Lindgomyces ingoldianus]
MLTLSTLLSLPVFLSTTIIAHALAAPELTYRDNKDDNDNLAASLTGGEKCDKKELKAIQEGFVEMNKLFQASIKVNWNRSAEQEFFGKPERLQNYTAMVEANLLRASQYSYLQGNTTRNPDIHVRCDDPMKKCQECTRKEGKHVAYTIGNDPHINFCERYFDLPKLDDAVEKAAGNLTSNLEIMSYYNRATAWARQVMHISAVGVGVVEKAVVNSQSQTTFVWTTYQYTGPLNVSFLAGVKNEHPDTNGPNNIEALKYGYGANRAKLLAVLSTQMPYDALNNPDNYALYAQARYVMEKKGLYPNFPVMQFDDEMEVLSNEQLQDGARPRYACFDALDIV